MKARSRSTFVKLKTLENLGILFRTFPFQVSSIMAVGLIVVLMVNNTLQDRRQALRPGDFSQRLRDEKGLVYEQPVKERPSSPQCVPLIVAPKV